MMFRRLYWITEQVEEGGKSRIAGVFTSIPDLIRLGIEPLRNKPNHGFRLTLTKLDSANGTLGTWQSPDFEALENGLQEFVQTDEFSEEHCKALVSELRSALHAHI